jgi:hypothetical protein
MTRPTPRIAAAVLLLCAAIVIIGAIGGLMSARADSDAWPVTCDAAGCVLATVTPVVWDEATAAAVATWEAGRVTQ